MFAADIAGKLPELERGEDYLTSCVFGLLKYLPPERGLFLLIKNSFNYQLKVDLVTYFENQNIMQFQKCNSFRQRNKIYRIFIGCPLYYPF